MRVLRVYHGGRIPTHRARDRALVDAGVEVVLVVPSEWPGGGSERVLADEPFRVIELPVVRPGDVNRHRHHDDDVRRVLTEVQPDVLDLHEEPFSVVAHQWLEHARPDLPVAMYTAQNIDKRYPPPFAQWERQALRRVTAMYPCSRQAASVVRGKGFAGHLEVLPLGYDPTLFHPGPPEVEGIGPTTEVQEVGPTTEVEEVGHDRLETPLTATTRLAVVGRMVKEKGVLDAVRVLAAVSQTRDTTLVLIGDGPALAPATALARELGVHDRLELHPWVDTAGLAGLYRTVDVVLVPSLATSTWVEQFGRVIVEAQASGAVVAGYHSGAIPEVCAGAGVLAAEGDVTGLVNAVRRLLDDPARVERLRVAGLGLSGRRTWSAVAHHHAALLRTTRMPPAQATTGRAAARAELGPPALVGSQMRPFALPVLRDSRAAGKVFGAVVDWTVRR